MNQGLCRCELAGVDVHPGAVCRGEDQGGQRAGVIREPDVARSKQMPRLVVPEIWSDATCQPKPADGVFSTAVFVAERDERSSEQRGALGVALGKSRCQRIQEQVGRTSRLRARRRRTSSFSYFEDAALTAQAAREDRGRERFEIRLARKRGVKRFELSRGLEQQRRGITSAAGEQTRSGRAAVRGAQAGSRLNGHIAAISRSSLALPGAAASNLA